jgi:DNA (cytosine-5)-methyltransferase 1
MAQIHIKLPEEVHKALRKKARGYNYSIQEFAEKVLSLAVNEPDSLFSSYKHLSSDSEGLFTFVDLFGGIGGIRLAFEENGGRCIFSSEWDKWSQKTYFENFGEIPEGDINKVDLDKIPDHDILTAGFPCQPFSIAGVSKKKSLGKEHGFRDKTQGTLFFRIAEILDKKKPKAFMLENVKNLKSHDKGNTFSVIDGTLRELGYAVYSGVIDAAHYVPQHRERLFIVGFDRKVFGDEPKFRFPVSPKNCLRLKSIFEKKVDPKYILTDKLWKYLQDYAEKHRQKGNGFGYGLFDGDSVARTLSARYYKDGSEILIKRNCSNPRRLTPRECARLMGFPDSFKIPVSDTQAYRQFGNSVVVPVVSSVAAELIKRCKPFLEKNVRAS